MDNTKIRSFSSINPMIYCYTTPEIHRHDGWVKIGYTDKQTVEERIKQQDNTPDVITHLEWSSRAIYTDEKGGYFMDHDFHDYLTRIQHVERIPKKEWFHIDGKTAKRLFRQFQERDYSLAQTGAEEQSSYTLRKEQQEAVDMTASYYESHKDDMLESSRSFLWNAKPRFGKTLATYDFIRRIHARNVLIVTNRPSIANSWYQDFTKFIAWQTNYKFVSETDSLKDKNVLTRDQYLDWLDKMSDEDSESAGMIAFESLQGLKGSVYFGGQYDKLRWMAGRIPGHDDDKINMKWDVLVIDEAHEGVDTYKTDKAFDNIERTFTLHLSGTPFKAIANSKFAPDQIYNWSYEDEQAAKADWQPWQGTNPYEKLPRLNLFTYQLSNMIRDKVQSGIDLSGDDHEDYAFDLNEFFRVENGKFVYEKDVWKFLNTLTTNEKYPFSTHELRNELKHSFWLFNRVDSVKAMAKMLGRHPVFENYEIVVAAGDGKADEQDDSANQKSYDKVIEAIKTHDKTITLSVCQLTTGVTVKPWTAVLMLSNMKSPAEYMQAAFRAQNPYTYEGKDGKLYQKENAYVFDFAPERTLIIFDEFANNLNSSTVNGGGTKEDHEQNIRRLLNFFPVLAEDDEGKMTELDAAKVLTIPKAIKAREVVRRGFMCNFLFQNIGNIFSAPAMVLDILEKLTPSEEQADKKNSMTMHDRDSVNVNENGEVEVPEEIIINTTGAVFGGKIYEDVTQQTEEVLSHVENDESSFKKAAESVAATLTDVMEKAVNTSLKDTYDLTKGKTDQINRQVKKEIKQDFQHLAEDHIQKQKILETEHKEQIKQASTKEEAAVINDEFMKKSQEIAEQFTEQVKQKAQDKLQETQENIVRDLETKKEKAKQKSVEDDIRAHLRGFTRTIPSFIMAYSEMAHNGSQDLCLANFDDYTPDDVFKEVTGITEENFRLLRDGGEYTDENGNTAHWDGHFFNEVVFDESIQQFLVKKGELADYFDESHEEDIFDYIPPQKTNQIFTPKNVVKQMVDALEKENPGIFDDPDKTFVDFYMKSGLYITEIVKRLFKSEAIKTAYPDDHERLKHILEHQVYGFAPSHIIYSIAIAYIFGFDKAANSISKDNFIDQDVMKYIDDGKLDELVQEKFGK